MEYLTLGLLCSLWNIYHSTTAYFFWPTLYVTSTSEISYAVSQITTHIWYTITSTEAYINQLWPFSAVYALPGKHRDTKIAYFYSDVLTSCQSSTSWCLIYLQVILTLLYDSIILVMSSKELSCCRAIAYGNEVESALQQLNCVVNFRTLCTDALSRRETKLASTACLIAANIILLSY